jgi:3-phenylpropionate/trans-cinnamate dioxygenase ferredoxin component
MMSGGNWVTVASRSALAADSAIGVTVGEIEVAVYDVGGDLYATDNICPHAYAHLSGGWLEDDIIECPLHAARFEVKTGKFLDGPADCDIKTFPVRVVGDDIQIDVTAAEAQ